MAITQDLTIHKTAFKAYDYNLAPRLIPSQVRLHKRPVRQSYTSTHVIEKGMWISPTPQFNQEYPCKDMIFNSIEDAMVEISPWAQNGGFTVRLGRSRLERESSTNGFLALRRRDRLPGKINWGWAVKLRSDKFANGLWVVHQVKLETAANAEYQGHNHSPSKEDVAHSIRLLGLNSEHKNKIEKEVRSGHKISTVADTLRGT
ncbi:hypothetical protein F5H01DRAFT_320591 [Linnemannia elongata]|nr:hypothetical protein F5H01DRAFT_320591 [Linnemannia elongata]